MCISARVCTFFIGVGDSSLKSGESSTLLRGEVLFFVHEWFLAINLNYGEGGENVEDFIMEGLLWLNLL